MYKCNYCDKKGERSIDTQLDDYVRFKNKYYHRDCLYEYIHKKYPDKNKDELDDMINKELMKTEHIKEFMYYKDMLYQHLFARYSKDISPYIYINIDKVVAGEYKNMNVGISYKDLYKMWTHKKFLRKLDKVAYGKSLSTDQRISYDLAIIIKEYPKYKKAQNKKILHENTIEELVELKQKSKSLLERKKQIELEMEKNKEKEELKDEIDVEDLLDI